MQTLHREDIKAGIRKKFGSLKAFEAARGLCGGSAKGVLMGKSSSRTVAAIADELDLSVDMIKAAVHGAEISIEADCTSTKVDCHRLNAGLK